MASIRAFTCNDTTAELDYIQDYGLALKAMRREIFCLRANAMLDPRAVRNLIKLIAAVSFQQDCASMEAHLECLAVLLRKSQRQGTQLSSFCRAWLKQWQGRWSISTGKTRIFIEDEPDPEVSMPSIPLNDNFHSKLPLGFQKLIQRYRLTSTTIQVLHRIASRIFGYTLPDAYISQPRSEGFSLISPYLSEQVTFDKLLRLTLVLYANMLYMSRDSNGNLTPISVELSKRKDLVSIIPTFQVQDPAEEECVRWMWLLTAMSFKSGDGSIALGSRRMLTSFKLRHARYANSASVDRMYRDFLGHGTLSDPFEDSTRIE